MLPIPTPPRRMSRAIFLPRVQSLAPTDALGAGILLVFLCGWHLRVTGWLSAGAVASLLLFVAICLIYGSLFVRFSASLFSSPAGLAYKFLTGYFVFNSLLFIAALCSPFGMVANVAGLGGLAVLGLAAQRHYMPAAPGAPANAWAVPVAIAISCIGATIWCDDAQSAYELRGDHTIFHVWHDTFIHVREISMFAQSHGLRTVHDIKQAWTPAPVYHFASYLSPAFISAFSGESAMQVYASFQLPLGIFLTGLAAFCLMSKMFGCWPGVAAAVAIVLFPDAYQQGFQHRYLSYNFLAQVNLGMLYGIACAALAWMFMLDACKRGKIATVFLSYTFLVLCLFYKAHLFVANSYVLMMFPIIFFVPLRLSWRIALGCIATMLFCAVVSYAQTNPRVPVLRLDGSGISTYLASRLGDYDHGWVRDTFRRIFLEEHHSKAAQGFFAALMLAVSTFGIWVIATAAVLLRGRRLLPPALWWFPVIVVVNYLVMALGLALDSRGVGTPDELLNRPLVWAYFALAAWTAAAGYRLFVGDGLPKSAPAKSTLFACLLACAAVTIHVAPNLQTFPLIFGKAMNAYFTAEPTCLVQAADYLRRETTPGDIVQDSIADPHFALTALSERQLFVGAVAFGGASAEQSLRLNAIEELKQIDDATAVGQFAASRGINWFLQHPGTQLAWPDAIQNRPTFVCGGFRLFHLTSTTKARERFANRPPSGDARVLE